MIPQITKAPCALQYNICLIFNGSPLSFLIVFTLSLRYLYLYLDFKNHHHRILKNHLFIVFIFMRKHFYSLFLRDNFHLSTSSLFSFFRSSTFLKNIWSLLSSPEFPLLSCTLSIYSFALS